MKKRYTAHGQLLSRSDEGIFLSQKQASNVNVIFVHEEKGNDCGRSKIASESADQSGATQHTAKARDPDHWEGD